MSSEQPTQVIGTGYLATLQGVCKIVEVVASFIAVLLVGINTWGTVFDVFESAAALSIIISAILLILYTSKAVEKLQLPWNRIQFFYHVILSIYYIIAIALVLDKFYVVSRIIGGGVLGILAVIAHLLDGYDNYRKHPLC
ncbi:uncharacterized protein LOC135146378 [Zophobas morio]|uniref:uncharacterized protein LOC135146378 n=1 Tax=Zophobas morio TaxID=2755281 RepID=UPI0030839FE4